MQDFHEVMESNSGEFLKSQAKPEEYYKYNIVMEVQYLIIEEDKLQKGSGISQENDLNAKERKSKISVSYIMVSKGKSLEQINKR